MSDPTDQDGIATTRLQVRALSLRTMKPIQTSCGAFHVTAALHGVQPMTEMTIRQTKAGSGTFDAPLAMNVRLTFTPARVVKVGARALTGIAWNHPGLARTLTLDHVVELGTTATPWQSEQPETNLAGQVGGFVMVDTDNDGLADTYIPGQLAFYPMGDGRAEKFGHCIPDEPILMPVGTVCHNSGTPGKCHCVHLTTR